MVTTNNLNKENGALNTPSLESKHKNASDKFIVYFNDGTTQESDRFTLAVTFKTGISESENGEIIYKGDSYSFVAKPLK